jgi:hypothetical protein
MMSVTSVRELRDLDLARRDLIGVVVEIAVMSSTKPPLVE